MATAQKPATIEDRALAVVKDNPEEAIRIVNSYHERLRKEETALASVRFTPQGIQCDNALGLWRIAQMYSGSGMVPEHLQGKPYDCMIIMQLSQRMRVDFFMLAQSCYVVSGRPGLEAKLAIALLNESGKIRGRIRYEFTDHQDRSHNNDAFGCRAVVTDADTGDRIEGPWVTWEMVKAEGWLGKKGSKWQSMAEQMFRYRSATFLTRAHYPEVMMGMPTVDEIEDVGAESPAPGAVLIDERPKSERLADEFEGRISGAGAAETGEDGSESEDSAGDAEGDPQEPAEPSEWYEELRTMIQGQKSAAAILNAEQELLAARSHVSEAEYDQLKSLIAEKREALK